MIVTGLIAEYNPFHKGHEYHIEMAKRMTGADYIVVVMSGDFVQRGTPAIISKHSRAKMALLSGADLVLELPVLYATASAESFAYGGVKILEQLGITDYICFGSECADASVLMTIADILVHEPKWYSCALKQHLKQGMSYPAARAAALPEYQDILSKPNNILGIEYCKALLRLNSKITPVTLKREGAGYHDTTLSIPQEAATDSVSKQFASASGIRKHLLNVMNSNSTDTPNTNKITNANTTLSLLSHIQEVENQLPAQAYPVLKKELQENGALSEDDFSQLLFYRLLQLNSQEELFPYADMSEELANRVFKHRYDFISFSQFTDQLKTKEVTRTRINRALLHFLLDIKKTDDSLEVYGRILGFRKTSSELLSHIKKTGLLPLITKHSQTETILNPIQKEIFQKDIEASNLYEMVLSQKNNRAMIHEYQKQILLL